LEYVKQLAHAGMGDEADQDVHLIASRKLAAQLAQQRWRTFSSREQPRQGQAGGRQYRGGRTWVNGLKNLNRTGKAVDPVSVVPQALTNVNQYGIDQFQLSLKLFRPITAQVVQYAGQLECDVVGQSFWRILRRQGF
jgi:hypothetical protein